MSMSSLYENAFAESTTSDQKALGFKTTKYSITNIRCLGPLAVTPECPFQLFYKTK
jgi:hypothetical protein